jgi:hypothetical protein
MSADQNKKDLLDLARSGAPRPQLRSKQDQALRRTTTPSQMTYDQEFADQVKTLRPDWFKG